MGITMLMKRSSLMTIDDSFMPRVTPRHMGSVVLLSNIELLDLDS